MTTPWQRTISRPLAPPWEAFHVEVYAEPPLGRYLALEGARARLLEATERGAQLVALRDAVDAIAPLIAAHDLTDRDGRPLELSLEAMTGSLVAAICRAIIDALADGGATADPFPRAPSRRRSSAAVRSRRSSASGA